MAKAADEKALARQLKEKEKLDTEFKLTVLTALEGLLEGSISTRYARKKIEELETAIHKAQEKS